MVSSLSQRSECRSTSRPQRRRRTLRWSRRSVDRFVQRLAGTLVRLRPMGRPLRRDLCWLSKRQAAQEVGRLRGLAARCEECASSARPVSRSWRNSSAPSAGGSIVSPAAREPARSLNSRRVPECSIPDHVRTLPSVWSTRFESVSALVCCLRFKGAVALPNLFRCGHARPRSAMSCRGQYIRVPSAAQ
jgi:hypothetical protein